MKKVKKFLFL